MISGLFCDNDMWPSSATAGPTADAVSDDWQSAKVFPGCDKQVPVVATAAHSPPRWCIVPSGACHTIASADTELVQGLGEKLSTAGL